jgi:hypothetical protein
MIKYRRFWEDTWGSSSGSFEDYSNLLIWFMIFFSSYSIIIIMSKADYTLVACSSVPWFLFSVLNKGISFVSFLFLSWIKRHDKELISYIFNFVWLQRSLVPLFIHMEPSQHMLASAVACRSSPSKSWRTNIGESGGRWRCMALLQLETL